jgi:alkanesulfonate monooxygenase SsuD/methylene tetrahydromethanopterin reductase-like flavin-dependent oxidoreductase (luciferase family)
MDQQIKFGALLWPQYTDWESLRDAGALVDELGFDSLWTWDHLYPIVGDPHGPIFEGYLTLAGWAAVTSRVTLGLMVGANTFRNPALVAKMVTTLDHMSAGRAVLGLGGAWFEAEHAAYGLDFGAGFGERLDRLDEAVQLIRAMLDGEVATARGVTYHADGVVNVPRPIQARLPILIGGSGEKKTLQTAARYADMWNTGGPIDGVARADQVLRRWCDDVGRDAREIERTLMAGDVVIRDQVDGAEAVGRRIAEQNVGGYVPDLLGPPDVIVDHLMPYVSLGFRHLYFDVAAPFDEETLRRLISDVKPRIEERLHASSAVR